MAYSIGPNQNSPNNNHPINDANNNQQNDFSDYHLSFTYDDKCGTSLNDASLIKKSESKQLAEATEDYFSFKPLKQQLFGMSYTLEHIGIPVSEDIHDQETPLGVMMMNDPNKPKPAYTPQKASVEEVVNASIPVSERSFSIHSDSAKDFKTGEVGQWYYGACDLRSGEIYLVPSIDPETGKHATNNVGKFKNKTIDDKHGVHRNNASVDLGAGHMRAILDNHFFNSNAMTLKKHCAAFSIKKTGQDSFQFSSKSSINDFGQFQDHESRELPDDLRASISSNLVHLLNANVNANDSNNNDCLVM